MIMQGLKLILGHTLHTVILMLPTLLLARGASNAGPTAAFALIVVLAGVLESQSVVCESSVAQARDQTAILIARIVGVVMLMLFWSAQIEFSIRGNTPIALFAVGAMTAMVGTYLRIATIRALGKHFNSDIAVDGEIVETNLIRWLRHPSEVGMLIFVIGAVTTLGAVYCAVATIVIMTPISIWRIRRENDLIRPLLTGKHASGI